MKEDMLSQLRNYPVESIQEFLRIRKSEDIPQSVQKFILQLNSAINIIHHNGTNIQRASKQLMMEYPELSLGQAKRIFYDAIEFFYVDDSVSARHWDMVFADQYEDLKLLAIKEGKYEVARKCIEAAHKLRTTTRESMDYNWAPPVFLINISVKPESLGFKSAKMMEIARRHEDEEYKRIINSLETTDAEKARLFAEAGIKEVEYQKIDDDDE